MQFKILSQFCLLLAVAVTALGLGIEHIAVKMAVQKINSKMNPSQTSFVRPQYSTPEEYTPTYKDFYSKTMVDIRPVRKTTLYSELDYSTTVNQTVELSTVSHYTDDLQTVSLLQPSPVIVPVQTLSYVQYDWPTETQTYTNALNTSVTEIVENTIPII